MCPALIQLLGSPSPDGGGSRGKPTGLNGFPDSSPRNGRPVNPLTNRAIYSIAGELVRLVGGINSLRPTLESLFHRIILSPPVNQRTEALKVIKEVNRIPDIPLKKRDRLSGLIF